MMKGFRLCLLLVLAAGCGGGPAQPAPVSPVASGASRAQLDSIWQRGMAEYRRGKWNKSATLFERLTLEMSPGDPRMAEARFRLAESHLGQGNHLQATREFRKVSDEMSSDTLAPVALLRAGDAYADLWGRPELDPSYGQTALATYQELVSRYPSSAAAPRAQVRIAALQEKFARKELKAAQFYFKLKAYDSAILYLRDLVANYPKTAAAPEALLKLAEAYRKIDYEEDLRETCSYIRRFHPGLTEAGRFCPKVEGDTT